MKINEALEANGAAFTDTEIRDLHWRCHELYAHSSSSIRPQVCELHQKLLGLMLLRGFRHRNTGELIDKQCVPYEDWSKRDPVKLIGARKPLQKPDEYSPDTFKRLHVRCHTVWSVLSTRLKRPPEELKNVHDRVVRELLKRNYRHPQWDLLDSEPPTSGEVKKTFASSDGEVPAIVTIEMFLSCLPDKLEFTLPNTLILTGSTLHVPEWIEEGSRLLKAITFNVGRRFLSPTLWDEYQVSFYEDEPPQAGEDSAVFKLEVLSRRPFVTFHHSHEGDRYTTVIPEFITLVGGLAIHFITSNDIDVRICDVDSSAFIDAVQAAILDSVEPSIAERISFLIEPLGVVPFTTYTPLYDVILVKEVSNE